MVRIVNISLCSIMNASVVLQAFGCIDQDRDGVIKKQDLKETYGQLGSGSVFSFIFCSLTYP